MDIGHIFLADEVDFFHIWPVVLSQTSLKSHIDFKALNKLQSPTPEMSLNSSSWPSIVLYFQPFKKSSRWWLHVTVAVLLKSYLFYLIWVAEAAALKGFMFHCNSIMFWVTTATKTQAYYFQFGAFFLVSNFNSEYPVSQSYLGYLSILQCRIHPIQEYICTHNVVLILIQDEIISLWW